LEQGICSEVIAEIASKRVADFGSSLLVRESTRQVAKYTIAGAENDVPQDTAKYPLPDLHCSLTTAKLHIVILHI